MAAGANQISSEFLAAQRRQIYQRLSPSPSQAMAPRSRMRLFWAPALATACVLALGVFVYHPRPETKPAATAEISDAQLFTEVFSMEQSLESSATAPVRALFEEQQ